jgi:5-(carboxyamino)imidazole ribonucleotide synthase
VKPQVWVIGAGQLGAMLKTAGRPLALRVIPVEPESELPPTPEAGDMVTAEREQWPDTPTAHILANHPNFVNGPVFGRLADRLSQKQLMDELGLPTAAWQNVTSTTTTDHLLQCFGPALVLKRRTGGYDGRGQHWIRSQTAATIPPDWADHCIAEQAIAFDEEVSLVGARTRDGQCVFYPLTLNLHVDGILMASAAPLPRLATLQTQAQAMLARLMQALDYTGVMAMECFRVGDQLLINELAPRVHNSGHWTQAGSSCSQFESHLRAVTGLPLPVPLTLGLSVMVNLIGTVRDNRWLQVPGARLYWYDKEVRPGRKVGHINFCDTDPQRLITALTQLEASLPAHYARIITWLQDTITLRNSTQQPL